MELTGIGGGVMVALAAGLWLAYLVPNWLKRHEYLATERNAVRLQQTIRVLAETSEVPAAVQAEAAALRLAQAQRAEFRRGPVAVGRRPSPAMPDARLVYRRRRRTRALSALALLAAIVIVIVQVSLMVTTGAVGGSWVVLGIATAVGVVSVAALARLAEVSRSRGVVARPARRTSLGAQPVAAPVRQAEAWTPVPVPKPLYLSRPEAPAAPAAADPRFELELAAASAERALRAAARDVPAMPTAPTSRFASMGIVDDASTAAPDLDAVLARRRAAG